MGRTWLKFRWIAIVAIWLGAVSVGMAKMLRYSLTAGATGPACVRWPGDCPIQPSQSGVTLVVALHPRCACSCATLAELSQIMSRRNGDVHAIALFVRPAETSDGWEHTGLWEDASAIPGVRVVSDPGGVVAQKFGALTSGQVSAFDRNGKLLFSGGITPSRGHMGDNAGADAVTAIIMQQRPSQTHTPVFGCSLIERTP